MPTDSSNQTPASRGEWRVEYGVLAVVLWTVVVGIPLLMFHFAGQTLTVVDHVHAAVLFIASEGIIFWFFGRPRPQRALPDPPPSTAVPVPFSAVVPASQQAPQQATPGSRMSDGSFRAGNPQMVRNDDGGVVAAELVEDTRGGRLPPRPPAVTLTIANYLASSRPRLVQVTPAGGSHRLLPNQSLQIIVVGDVRVPEIRVTESDDATQVECDFARSVTCSLLDGPSGRPQSKDLL